MSAPSLPNPLGPYRLERKLGGGGFADVWLAVEARRGRQVALKVLLPRHANTTEVLQRFRREGEQMLKLRHPHIVTAFDAGQVEGCYFIAMEYMPGGSLTDLLERRRPLDVAKAAAIVTQVAAALDYVHPGIIHRDLKPRNILFDAAGTAKVADFGIARVTDQATLTGYGQILGTPQYMAPEQANPRLAPISPATDVWALGVIFYEMLCGRAPFVAEEPSAVLYQVVHEPPPRPISLNPGLPPAAEPILATALAKDARQRYQRAGQMAAEVQRLAQQARPFTPPPVRPAAHTPTPAPHPVTPPPKRSSAPVLLGTVGVIVLLAFLLWQFALRPAPRPEPTLPLRTATPVIVPVVATSAPGQRSNTSTVAPLTSTPSMTGSPPAGASPTPSPSIPATRPPQSVAVAPTAPPDPVAPCPPFLRKPRPGMGLLLIENHIGEPLHIDDVGTGQKWDIPAKQGDTPGRLLLDLPPGDHVLVDNTPRGQGRIGVTISPGSAFVSPISYNARTEEYVYPLEIPNSCR